MKRFYVVWFFFCASWGYLATQFTSDLAPPASRFLETAALGAICTSLWLAIEMLRGIRLSVPSLSLPPWDQPVGLMLFGFLTFLFSGLWGLLLARMMQGAEIQMSVYACALSIGALAALYGCFLFFPSRFRV
ncbi:MAG TPA: hypothetical protein VM491_12910 [Burkholderiaceae bacterium]|jgi:hypothetical protein|nr:hypothetical protein [Burkholderiaceae bacterium]